MTSAAPLDELGITAWGTCRIVRLVSGWQGDWIVQKTGPVSVLLTDVAAVSLFGGDENKLTHGSFSQWQVSHSNLPNLILGQSRLESRR